MNNSLRDAIMNLSEREAKMKLYQLLQPIDKHCAPDQIAVYAQKAYQLFLRNHIHEATLSGEEKVCHILFNQPSAGALKQALSSMELHMKERVLTVPQLFSVGPLEEIAQSEGLQSRYEWLQDHLIHMHDVQKERRETSEAIKHILKLKESIPIIIWTGNNAQEQIGTRWICSLLIEKQNPLLLINVPDIFSQLYYANEETDQIESSGELSPEWMKQIYQASEMHRCLTQEEKVAYRNEWAILIQSASVLRTWKNGQIIDVQENYYDYSLIQSARKLQQGSADYIAAGQLIGEAISHCKSIDSSYLEYRLRMMILNGLFEMKGTPVSMYAYRVRLQDNVSKHKETKPL
ncbi:DUF1835 domain-containing protein [Bacillus sp. 1P06AnD]|uniref:DUF1835 domain-containing protein n=1 Tax=Bacillus sp. 1P06AnD TaxID=3132208 RepID=UPI0039A030FF